MAQQDGLRTPRTSIVHKDNEEGALVVDTYTGEVKTPIEERPDWAAGLVQCNPGERVRFYQSRLGPDLGAAFETPDLINFADLQWETISEDQEAITMEADADHRMDNLSELTGIARIDGLDEVETYGKANVLAEVEIGMQTGRSPAEAEALSRAQDVDTFAGLVAEEQIKAAVNG